MKPDQMWQAYKILNRTIGDRLVLDIWHGSRLFGRTRIDGAKRRQPVQLELYAVGSEPLPKGKYLSVILDNGRMLFVLLKRRKLESLFKEGF